MTFRIQKLLYSEYSDFEDTVLVESPFAETTREGKGIRQVQIGLTPTKFIVASYHLEPADGHPEKPPTTTPFRSDPDIESFELVLAYPVESVNLSVFRHRRRQTLKARFSNGNVSYYEIGGWSERTMVWKLWCERLRFLAPYESRTSASETSVGSSLTSVATATSLSLYIVRSTLSLSKSGLPTLWCHYESTQSTQPSTWSDPHLYLGPSFTEKGINFMCLPDLGKRMSQRAIEQAANLKSASMKDYPVLSCEMESLARQAVELWESQRLLRRTPRSYGIWPFPGLHSGLGLWRVTKPQAYSLQTKRCASEVNLCAVGCRPDLPRLPTNLARTTSLEHLPVPALTPDQLFQLIADFNAPKTTKKMVTFTMCEPNVNMEWNRRHYKRQQRQLNTLRLKSSTYTSWMKERRKTSRSRFQSSKIFSDSSYRQISSETLASGSEISRSRKNRSILSVKGSLTSGDKFKTSSLAHQLIMIDKQLFLSLDTLELSRVRKDTCGVRGPNLTRLLAFAHRVSCLVASQITAEKQLKARAVLVVRWVGVAYKCHRLHSLQSAESVLRGLQSPAVYRLRDTWTYVRRHHASKYRRFEDLCRRYRDVRHPLYLQAFARAQRAVPNLPSATLLVATLTHRMPKLKPQTTARFPSESCLSITNMSLRQPRSKPLRRSSVSRFLSAISFNAPRSSIECNTCASSDHLHTLDSYTLEANLGTFFTPVLGLSPANRAMEDAQFFLETHQAAVTRYAMPKNQQIRACLLLETASGPGKLFEKSKKLEFSGCAQ